VLDLVQQSSLLPPAEIASAEPDEEMTGRELRDRVLEGEERIVVASRP